MRNFGFTLAEVLITLGVIGVVAAMTIPTLVGNYQKHVTAVKVKNTYSILAQAIKMSEIYNGNVSDWELPTIHSVPATEKFLQTYILPYLKAPLYCGSGISSEVEAKCGYPLSGSSQSYMLQNGSVVSIYPLNHEYIMPVIVDINGPQKPNLMGTDVFYFLLTKKGFLPFGGWANLSREDIINGKTIKFSVNSLTSIYIACKSSTSGYNRHGCTYLLMQDGWEFKKDYPYVRK